MHSFVSNQKYTCMLFSLSDSLCLKFSNLCLERGDLDSIVLMQHFSLLLNCFNFEAGHPSPSVDEGFKVNPRYLCYVVQLIVVSLTLMLSCLSLNFPNLLAVPNNIASVFPFLWLIINSFLRSQLARVLIS